MQKFIIQIEEENFVWPEDKNLECFLLSNDLSASFKADFALKAKKNGKIVLGFSADDCLSYQLDGVLLDLSKSENIKKDYQSGAENLKNKIVGAICRNRRHEAMLVSECEPDFVVFKAWADGAEKVKELTAWYAEMFLIQSALLPVDEVDYSAFKTDFVILSDRKYVKKYLQNENDSCMLRRIK
ncbi:MAG: hypothetical protein J5895_02555 [Alphaproteobacteria bacterium]|nr:hypothetical protein [Alphaproteobacteria bacterium]